MEDNRIKKIIEKCMKEIEKIDSDYDYDYFTIEDDRERSERIDQAKACAFDEIVRTVKLG